jgi:hypothetical protein
MRVGRIAFAAGLSAEEIQQRSLERLERETRKVKPPHYCNGALHFLEKDAATCVCGSLHRETKERK